MSTRAGARTVATVLAGAVIAGWTGPAAASAQQAYAVLGDGTESYPVSTGAVGDGAASGLAPAGVQRVAALADGGFLVTDSDTHTVRRVGTDGVVRTVAGSTAAVGANTRFYEGAPATAVRLYSPDQVVGMPDGGFVFSDGGLLRRVSPDGRVTTMAGGGPSLAEGAEARRARLEVRALALMPDGSLLVSSLGRIRRIGLDGRVFTVAGNGTNGDAGDGGPAINASLRLPDGLAALPDGGFLIADT